MLKFENLTPEEVQAFETRKQEKENVFVFSNSFDLKAWKDLKGQMEALDKRKKIEPSEKANGFLQVLEGIYTEPRHEKDGPRSLPAFAIVDMFERSFEHFRKNVDPPLKKELVEVQMALLTDGQIPEEARNAMKGIWGFYADPERRGRKHAAAEEGAPDPEDEAREELLSAIRDYRQPYDEDPQSLANLPSEEKTLLYLPDERSWRDYEPESEAKSVLFFSNLYEADQEPLEPELTGVLQHEMSARHGVSGRYEATGVVMPPHDRIYSFENNRLPRTRTMDEGRVQFCITADAEVLKGNQRKTEVIADMLPFQLLDFFRNAVQKARYSKEYHKASAAEKMEMRQKAVAEFSEGLMDTSSELWKTLREQNVLDPEDAKHLEQLLDNYRKLGVRTYLVSRIAINRGGE